MSKSLFLAAEDLPSDRAFPHQGEWVFNHLLTSLAVIRLAQFIMEVYTLNNRGATLAMCTGTEDIQHEICLYERPTMKTDVDNDVYFYGEHHREIEQWEMRCGPKIKDYLDSMKVDALKAACIPLNIYGDPVVGSERYRA